MRRLASFAKKGLVLTLLAGFLGFGFSSFNLPSTTTNYYLKCEWWCPATGFGSSSYPCGTQGCYNDAWLACGGPALISC